MKKPVEITSVEPVFAECGDHVHLAGIRVGFETPAEESNKGGSSVSVGAGNKRYEANYDNINWN